MTTPSRPPMASDLEPGWSGDEPNPYGPCYQRHVPRKGIIRPGKTALDEVRGELFRHMSVPETDPTALNRTSSSMPCVRLPGAQLCRR